MNVAGTGQEWNQKGASLSDKSARKEFGLTQEEILQAIRAGKLQYHPPFDHRIVLASRSIFGPFLFGISRETKQRVATKTKTEGGRKRKPD